MDMVNSAFSGDRPRMNRGIFSCTKNKKREDGSSLETTEEISAAAAATTAQPPPSKLDRLLKLLLLVLFLVTVYRLLARKYGGNEIIGKQSSLRGGYTDLQQQQLLPGDVESSPSNIDDNTIVHHAIFPPHLSHLSNLTTPYDHGGEETPYFWDVHFSGESIAEYIFGNCHGLVQACEFGLRQPNYNDDVSVMMMCVWPFFIV